MRERVQSIFVVAVSTAATAAFAPLLAQTTKATLVGTVTDRQGAAIARGTVTVRDTATGAARQVQTDDTECYRVYPSEAGAYDVTASLMDFPSKVASNVVAGVAANVKADFSPEAGAVSELLNFSANTAILPTQDATLGGTFSVTQTGNLAGKRPQFSQGWFYSDSITVMKTK
jgi:Carboxypeptidase regulatory-like domain